MTDLEANLTALSDVMDGYQRLERAGLVKASKTERGINADGMQTLADLLAVLVFQTGTGDSAAEQVASATGRAMFSALGDLFGEMADQPTNGAGTLQLLTAAVREARS